MCGICSITCTGRGKPMSMPIRTWSPGSGIRPSWNRSGLRGRYRDFRRLAGLLEPAPGRGERGQLPQAGMALLGPGRPGRPAAVGRGVGAGRGAHHAPHRARPRRATTWGCGGSLSGTPRITFTWWPRWPARTGTGPACGTATASCGTPAGIPRSGSGCARLPRRIAPRPGGPRAPRRNKRARRGQGEPAPGHACAARCAPRRPGHAPRTTSLPTWPRQACWSAAATAPRTLLK